MTNSIPTPDEAAAEAQEAMRRIIALREQRASIDAELKEQAARATRAFRQHAVTSELLEQPYSTELFRTLYWQYPEVWAANLGKALGIKSAAKVAELAGAGEFEQACSQGCGNTVHFVVRTRSEMHNPTGRSWPVDDPRVCDECANAIIDIRRQIHEAWLADRVGRLDKAVRSLRTGMPEDATFVAAMYDLDVEELLEYENTAS